MQDRTLSHTQTCARSPCTPRTAQLSAARVSRFRSRVVVNTANVNVQPGQAEPHPSVDNGPGGRCPFLAALRTPATVHLPWHKRVQLQILDPAKFHSTVLKERGSDNVVQVVEQPLFDTVYVPATMQLSKEVFAAEGSGTVTQGLALKGNNIAFKGFATLLGEDSLLVVADPDRHKYLRTLLQPAFNADAIATYLPDIQSLIEWHLASWEAAGSQGVKAYECLKTLTFEFILQVAMGQAIPDAELHRLSDLFNAVTRGLVAWPFLDIPFTPWNKALRAQKELLSYFQSGVTAARKQLSSGGQVPGVLGRLMTAVDEHGNMLTDREICENMLLLLVAGHDTSSTTLTRCMSNLQDHPEVVEKLRVEQATIVAKHGEPITAAALRDMAYADAVLRETLRLDPVISQVVRVTTKDFNLGGYDIPAGERISLPLTYLAESEPRWADEEGNLHPSVFNPERMLTPTGAKPGQLMPFGGGVRYCLGAGLSMAEMKVYLAALARSYDFTVDNDTQWKPALGYYPANGLPMVVTKYAD